MSWVERLWYGRHPARWLLLPLSGLFGLVAALRRLAYRRGWRTVQRLPVPVVVIGNINAGGVGKTPVVIAIVEVLQAHGWQPGVVSRGYGGRTPGPVPVHPHSDPAEVGDEPVLIAHKTGVPVAVGRERAAAARLLVAQGVSVIVADDGLQHYALGRDVEIIVIDGQRRFGNGHLLPAGPLRESAKRLESAHLLLVNGPARGERELPMSAQLGDATNLLSGETRPLRAFGEVIAVAGIGVPEKFFRALEGLGLRIERQAFPDHHAFRPRDLEFDGDKPILMTEKDAVKCRAFQEPRLWSVAHRVSLPPEAWPRLAAALAEKP